MQGTGQFRHRLLRLALELFSLLIDDPFGFPGPHNVARARLRRSPLSWQCDWTYRAPWTNRTPVFHDVITLPLAPVRRERGQVTSGELLIGPPELAASSALSAYRSERSFLGRVALYSISVIDASTKKRRRPQRRLRQAGKTPNGNVSSLSRNPAQRAGKLRRCRYYTFRHILESSGFYGRSAANRNSVSPRHGATEPV